MGVKNVAGREHVDVGNAVQTLTQEFFQASYSEIFVFDLYAKGASATQKVLNTRAQLLVWQRFRSSASLTTKP
jgi:hypothetical protein